MSIEDFFAIVNPIAEQKDKESSHAAYSAYTGLSVGPVREQDGAGWRAAFAGGVSWGDTPGDAIQAAHDHFLRLPSRHARLHPPFFSSDREAKDWSKAHRVDYDYRTKDWEPPEE